MPTENNSNGLDSLKDIKGKVNIPFLLRKFVSLSVNFFLKKNSFLDRIKNSILKNRNNQFGVPQDCFMFCLHRTGQTTETEGRTDG